MLNTLRNKIKGKIYEDNINRILYSTDASAYREKPLAVIIPENKNDLIEIIKFVSENNLAIIPRAAGTSLAGQVVGNGIVVDISKHFREIIEINIEEKWVKVQPGVVLDELNKVLEKHNLFFSPETSTSNRCMMA
ncbi:MAG: FAD-binding oxidoreductase, partial [Bacteroidales bacterium]|nr:FAD-binding oxidoreductase [Bacteroidales bacterium]